MLIFTAHTPAYSEYADRLRESCRAAGYALMALSLPETGSWVQNCAQKAVTCRRVRGITSGPILWLDADAEILGNVDGLDGLCAGFDVAHGARRTEVLSGTLWIGDTPRARLMLDAWVSKCAADPRTWDQRHLAAAIVETECSAVALAPEWCFIDKISERESPGAVPRIYHWQASRVMKARVGRE